MPFKIQSSLHQVTMLSYQLSVQLAGLVSHRVPSLFYFVLCVVLYYSFCLSNISLLFKMKELFKVCQPSPSLFIIIIINVNY